MESITLTRRSAVALSGNFAGANVVAGAIYYVVLGATTGLKVLGQITVPNFAPGSAFSITLSLAPGTYNVGSPGDPNNIYIVNAAGICGHGASSAEGQGSANITSTLSLNTRNAALSPSLPAFGEVGP
jgi:hypothetical protein